MKSIIFWDMTPCSLLSCNRRFGGTYRLPPACLLVLAEIISSTLKMEAICSSETSRRHIPEDDTLDPIYSSVLPPPPKETEVICLNRSKSM
jgi:hypothetical protein